MINGKPVILCTTDTTIDNGAYGGGRRTLSVNPDYSEAIYAAGGVPIVGCELCVEEMAEICDGLLLTGGADVDPDLYGEEPLNDTVHTDTKRTEFEVPLFKAFYEQKKPVMGICRGCQLINSVLGGNMYQDMVSQLGFVHTNNIIRHPVVTEKGSILNKLFGDQFLVNSLHHQSIKDIAPGMHVTARSLEGIVEAFEHDTLPIFATQFHPERLTGWRYDGRTKDFAPLFKHFVEMVEKDAKSRK